MPVDFLRRLMLVLLLSVVVSGAVLLAFAGFHYAVHKPDLTETRRALLQAFDRGAFLIADRKIEGLPIDFVRGSELFTDCLMYHEVIYRDAEVRKDLVNSDIGKTAPHPCDVLQATLGADFESRRSEGPYMRYWFGSRYLLQAFFPTFSVEQIRVGYKAASYVSALLLGLAGFCVGARVAVVLLTLSACLAAGMGFDAYGQSAAHAPTFFMPLFLLAAIVAGARHLVDWRRRAAAFCAVGTVVAYYDILSGGIPFALSLCLAVNYLVFDSSLSPYRRAGQALPSFLLTGAGFFFACVLTVAWKLLAIVYVAGNPLGLRGVVRSFFESLGDRLGSAVLDETVDRGRVIMRMWRYRAFGFHGSGGRARIFMVVALVAWLVALALAAWRRTRASSGGLLRDLGFLALAGLVVIAWYMAFVNHSYIHAFFMTRVMVLPFAYGFAGLVLVLLHLRRRAVGTAASGSA